MYDFVNPMNSAQYDDLTAFKRFYKSDLLPRCLEMENSGENYRIAFKAELGEIKKAAYKSGAMKIVVAIQNIFDSLQKGVQLLSLTDNVSAIEEAFDDVMHGDLCALIELYPLIDTAYKSNASEISELLEVMAAENDGLSLIYLIKDRGDLENITSEEIRVFEEKFRDPDMFQNIYDYLSDVYEKNNIDYSHMKIALLKEVLANMKPMDEDDDSNHDNLDKEIKNADILISDLGLDKKFPEKFLKGTENPSTELSQKYEIMSHILKLVVFSGNSNAFYALMEYQSFEDIFDSQKELFMEAMYFSDNSIMVLGTLEFLEEMPIEIHAKNVVDALYNLDEDEIEEIINSTISDKNLFAFNLIIAGLSEKESNEDTISLAVYALELALFSDSPEMVEIVLDSGILKASDIKDLDLHLMFGDAEETQGQEYINLHSKLPSIILNALADGNIELFDNLMTIIDYENINLSIDADATTPLMFALEIGNSTLVRHILDNYYDKEMLQSEALICTNKDGANIFHLIHPSLDSDLVDKILEFKGAYEAMGGRIEDIKGAECAGLTPLQSIIRKHGIDGADLINKYVGAGAGIWDEDSNGMNIFAWVELNAKSFGEDGPIYGLYQKMLRDIDSQIIESRKSSIGEFENDSAVSDLDSSSCGSESGGSTPQSPTCAKDFAFDASAWHAPLCRMDAIVGLSGESVVTSTEVDSY